jgi:hypothetical protein
MEATENIRALADRPEPGAPAVSRLAAMVRDLAAAVADPSGPSSPDGFTRATEALRLRAEAKAAELEARRTDKVAHLNLAGPGGPSLDLKPLLVEARLLRERADLADELRRVGDRDTAALMATVATLAALCGDLAGRLASAEGRLASLEGGPR